MKMFDTAKLGILSASLALVVIGCNQSQPQPNTVNAPPGREAYVSSCNESAWPDNVRCAVAPNNTLRLSVTENPNRDPDADDSMQYIIRHPERLAAMKQAGFDRLEFIIIDGNGPGKNMTTIDSLGEGGKTKLLQMSWEGTDGKMRCDPCEK
jgi:hypothetical protein